LKSFSQIHFPQAYATLGDSGYSGYMPFGFLTVKDFYIIWFSKLLTLNVPDEKKRRYQI
jgi:hypothetical protein